MSSAAKSASKDVIAEKPASAPVSNEESKGSKKSRSSKKVVNPANQGLNKRRHNIIVVRKTMLFKTLVIQTKNLLKN